MSEQKSYPEHWGEPPQMQTRDLTELPGGFGMGSSTLANWIQKNLDADNLNSAGSGTQKAYPEHWGEPPQWQTMDFRELPGGFGMGSSTLANWIQKNLDADKAKEADKTKGTTGSLTGDNQEEGIACCVKCVIL